MANKLSQLKNALGAGARANKYRIGFSIPATVPVSSNLRDAEVLCKGSSFPGATIGQIEAYNQGRKLVLPGDTTYTNIWTLTFYQTEDHALRKDMISWMTSADNFQNNTHSGNPTDVMSELNVEQLDSAGNVTATYTMHNVFVQEVSELTVGDDQIDTLQEFDIAFSYTDWVVGNGEMNNPASGNPATKNAIAE